MLFDRFMFYLWWSNDFWATGLNLEEFKIQLLAVEGEAALIDFCRRNSLHGLPYIFHNKETDYYTFRTRIADKFEVYFRDVTITGSAKLGFSPHKDRLFDLDSDIDIAIVSTALFEKIMGSIHEYQMRLRHNRKAVSERELSRYHKFLEYGAMGWMRPDLLPTSFRVSTLKNDWFDFFDSLSHGKSEVGNYKVNAGVFKTHYHLEQYVLSGLRSLQSRLRVKERDANPDKT